MTAEELRKLKEAFAQAAIVAMPYGALVIRRHKETEQREGWTLRTKLSKATDGEDLEQAFLLHDRSSDPHFAHGLLDTRLVLAPRLEVKVTYKVEGGSLVAADHIFEIDKPFIALGRMDEWMVPLLAHLDGNRTPAEICAEAKKKGDLPDGFASSDFGGLLVRLIERGFVLLPKDRGVSI